MDCSKVTERENEYSPSLYTKRFKTSEEVLTHFINVSTNATILARQLYKTRLDVRYGGDNDNQLLDIYYKADEESSPIFVYLHGGFWQELDKSSSGPFVHNLVDKNYRVLLVDYDTCPKKTLHQITKQISNFYKWLKVYAEETKAPNITICGHSAGAHLATQIFENEFLQPLHRLQLIQQMFLISGLYDLCELWTFQSCNPKNTLGLNADLAHKLSPQYCDYNKELVEEYRKQHLKIHILVAEHDSEAFQRQSYKYAEKLIGLHLEVKYQVFPSYDHFDIIEDFCNTNSIISCYIQNEMGLENNEKYSYLQ